MKKKRIALIVLMLIITLALVGCMPGDGTYTTDKPANLLSGIWHGWIAPVSLIFGLINHETRIYEPINTGWAYDFGFYIAIISGFGGLSLSRRRKKDKKD